MKKKTVLLALLLTAALGLTGCLGKEAGGELTAQGMESLDAMEYEEALRLFGQAVQEGEDQVLAYRGMGMASMGLARYEEAVTAFDQALLYTDEKMPETVEDLLLYKASAQYRLQDYEGTIDTCGRLVDEEENESSDALYLRGASYLCQGFQDQAKENFSRAVAAAPEDYTLYLNIYECYESQDLSALGDEYLQTALSIVPEEAEDYYHMGQIYYYLQQYDQAQSALLKPQEEGYLPALYLQGKIYLAQEDYAGARSVYESILTEHPDSAESYNGLALCALEAGEYDQALEYISRGLALEGAAGKQELYFNEIVVYERMLDFDTARAKAQVYVENYPTDEAGQKELEFLSTR